MIPLVSKYTGTDGLKPSAGMVNGLNFHLPMSWRSSVVSSCSDLPMEQDSVMKELRRIRDEYAEEFGYDIEAIFRDLKEQEKMSGRQLVRLEPRPVQQVRKAS